MKICQYFLNIILIAQEYSFADYRKRLILFLIKAYLLRTQLIFSAPIDKSYVHFSLVHAVVPGNVLGFYLFSAQIVRIEIEIDALGGAEGFGVEVWLKLMAIVELRD